MFDKIISYSVHNKFLIGLFVIALTIWGIYSLKQIPIDAVPDITNNQVQIITNSPSLATQEVEQFITTPVELSLQNLQRIEEIRSISRFGLSVVTVVFDEQHDIYLARQLVNERLQEAAQNIPNDLGTPEMAPISTGLGEIYQYAVVPKDGYKDRYDAIELRSIQDWIVRRQLSGIEGVAEINSIGGYLKQYEVAVDPNTLKSMNINISDIYAALVKSNENTGGAYIEKGPNAYYIRTEGLARSLEDIGNIVVNDNGSIPFLIKDVAEVGFGKAPRYGALVRNGEEVVGGKVMMFKGANSAKITKLIKEKVVQIQKSLPEGVAIEPFLVRDKLVTTAIGTVKKNLLEGGLIVIFILVLMLGNWRAGLIVASVIPLAMLFAISMMNLFGISANLMSLGAIDFGLIIDGAVIIVESIVHRLQLKFAGQKISSSQMNKEVIKSSQKIRNSAAFGEIIILMVYIPILALVGIEGKMFKPMAQTVMLAIAGALILSLTYVPMMTALFLNKQVSNTRTIADRIISICQKVYQPMLNFALRFKVAMVAITLALFVFSLFAFSRMGGEFIPTLEEGDLALQQILPPGSSLSQSVETAKIIQNKLLNDFHEIEEVVVSIGSAEIPTDPMPVEIGDYALIMKPKSEWTAASDRNEMFEKLEESLMDIPGIGYEFSQPIQLRFNELMTGTKADIAIKLYGEDLNMLYQKAKDAERIILTLEGVGTVNVEQTIGMPQLIVSYDYAKMAQYGLHVREVNQLVRSAFAGEKAGVIYEGEKRFDLVIRLSEAHRNNITDVQNLFITLTNGTQVPLTAVAKVELKNAPMQISRDNTNRFIVIGVNVNDIDVETLVSNIQSHLDEKVDLPSGYYFTYGGQFENLKAANARLGVAVPIALALIFILLYFTFHSVAQAALIFTAIPLSAIGGIWALQMRGMPFSISAGIGFIALFGVAVLNGIVLIGYFNQLKKEGFTDIKQRVMEGTKVRLRPVLMTAAVASFGFLPMALSTSGGAEVQRPLATVVIGGLITATLLTLLILPILYTLLEKWNEHKKGISSKNETMILIFLTMMMSNTSFSQTKISLNEAVEKAISSHPTIHAAQLEIRQNEILSDFKYTLGSTQISYQGDGLFTKNGQRQNQLRIVQSIPHPSGIKSLNQLNAQQLNISKLSNKMQIANLTLKVKEVYLNIQFYEALLQLYNELITLHNEYLKKAKIRMQVGATNALEKLSIQSKLNEYVMLISQTELEKQNFEKQLQMLLYSDENVTISEPLEKIDITEVAITSNYWIENARLMIDHEKAKVNVIEAGAKPDFNIGYAAQKFYEGGWLTGLQAGVTLPLFNKNFHNKINVQKIQIEVAEAQKEAIQIDLSRNMTHSLSRVNIYDKGMQFYENQKKEIVPEMKRIAELNYKAGELSYLELLNVLNMMYQSEKGYLNQLFEYNKAVAFYEYISTNQ